VRGDDGGVPTHTTNVHNTQSALCLARLPAARHACGIIHERQLGVRQRGVPQSAGAAAAAMLQVQEKGLLLQGVQGGTAAPPPRTARRTRACVCSLTHLRPCHVPLPALRCSQTAAWKAGHKHECGALGQGAAVAQLRGAAGVAARDDAGPAAESSCLRPCMTAEQRRLVTKLNELVAAGDWWGVVELEREALALARELRGADLGTKSEILNMLGICYYKTGDYGRAREMHEQDKAICEAMGGRRMARACCNLGNCFRSMGDYGRARELYEQDRAISEALGDRAWVALACGNLGICCHSTGAYGRAREMHDQQRAICEALGDRAGVAAACNGLGNCC